MLDRLRRLVAGDLATIRTEFGRFGRQVSGYSLEHLLPERGFDVARALVGSEGTLAARPRRHRAAGADAAHRGLVVLGYPSMAEAADATPGLLPHRPDRGARGSTPASCSGCATCRPRSSPTCRAARAG